MAIRRTRVGAALAASTVIILASVVSPPASASPASPPIEFTAGDDSIQVFTATISSEQLAQLRELGIDHESIAFGDATAAGVGVEIVMSGQQAADVARLGIDVEPKTSSDVNARTTSTAAAAASVFRPYSGPGGIREEIEQTAADHSNIVKLVTIGTSVNGQPIQGVKITKRANRTPDGARPAVLYVGTTHAREWISPEVSRRLMHYIIDGYGTDPAITKLVNTRELWFVPVLNPDGYDWTFEPGQRLWRKNLRDNNADGVITPGDGVDLNRNFSTKWGYDDEGSSPAPASETYRGPAPLSEPEDAALDALLARVGFEFTISYHSAAELLLYGTGWQVSTPSPDDYIYEALAGDDVNPAVPGYDPDISAELYTTNGEYTEHASSTYGVLGFTPELSTCATASAAYPDDAFEPAACNSVFNFPDDERLISEEFQKNIAFAISVAQSAADPGDPVSALGLTTPDLVADAFDVSYGSPQTVAVDAKRDVIAPLMAYRINGGRWRYARTTEWNGGERYGDVGDVYFAERRGVVRGARPGDTVEVKFRGLKIDRQHYGWWGGGARFVESEPFTYTVATASDAQVLVVANEDYTGVNPVQAGVTAPVYAATYTAALDANGISSETWDVDSQGVPHPLGVLSHFDSVIWETGDDRLGQDPEDEITDTPLGPLADLAVAERQQYLTIAVRDYLNEGGSLLYTGETVGYFGQLGGSLGGIYYGLNGAPGADCVVTSDFFGDCLTLSDDFAQYYLGAGSRTIEVDPAGVTALTGPLAGQSATFGGAALDANPLDEAGAFTPMSEINANFEGTIAAEYISSGGANPFAPVEGSFYAATLHDDGAYRRLSRAVDLTSAVGPATLDFQMSYDTEPGYDSVIIEAHDLTTDTWTTLPDANGATTNTVPSECEAGFLLEQHPFLTNYLTPGDPCTPVGSAGGAWNAFTGNSGGWQQVSVDLSAYVGKQVEVSITYVTDSGSGGTGVFVDDTRLTIDAVTTAEGFESGTLGEWVAGGPPPGSPPASGEFAASEQLINLGAAISTSHSVVLGFGIERLEDPAAQAAVVGTIIGELLAS